ncbi:MAG TPA: hypothetical protein VFG55_00595, partial [Rhodanobacteraceae bacterium]|nr:hypothetical protein [Rhodanobacteraceae bacterium]
MRSAHRGPTKKAAAGARLARDQRFGIPDRSAIAAKGRSYKKAAVGMDAKVPRCTDAFCASRPYKNAAAGAR